MNKIIITLIVVIFLMLALTQCKKECIKSDRCDLIPDAGLCMAYIPRYYYDKEDKKCKEFIWGGCNGIVPFKTIEECEKKCNCK